MLFGLKQKLVWFKETSVLVQVLDQQEVQGATPKIQPKWGARASLMQIEREKVKNLNNSRNLR